MQSWVEGQTQSSGRRQTDTQKHSYSERQPFLTPPLPTRALLPPIHIQAGCSGIPGPIQTPSIGSTPGPIRIPSGHSLHTVPLHTLSDHSIPPYGPNLVTLYAPSPIQTRPGHTVSWSPMQTQYDHSICSIPTQT